MRTPPYGLVFFDVDSTLVSIEGIDVLSGGDPEIEELTRAAMDGSIPVDQVYGRRLEKIRPDRRAIQRLAERYLESFTPGAVETVATLREAGCDVHLVTAGIHQAVEPLAQKLAVPLRALHAVRLQFDDSGQYLDFDRRSPLARPGGKELIVRNVRARAHGKAAFVGDGVTDLDTLPVVDLFIGFGGVTMREQVRDRSPIYLTDPDLRSTLAYLLPEER